MTVVSNRYEVMFLFDCENGNPNGDPDAGNSPRFDPEDMIGLVSDVAVKRWVRNYVQIVEGNKMPYSIFVQHATNLNLPITRAHEETGGRPAEKKAPKDKVKRAREWMCKNFYDVRTFGAVMSTGDNAGQSWGPVQIAISKSVDPIAPVSMPITRVAVTENISGAKSSEDFQAWEDEQAENKLHTMGRKNMIPYGLYVGKCFINANLAQSTGFNEDDLDLFFEALVNMYDQIRSSSKSSIYFRGLYVFKHVGTTSNQKQRRNQQFIGCCPANYLLDLGRVIDIKRISNNVEPARNFSDYAVTVNMDNIPNGVELYSWDVKTMSLKIHS